MKQGQKVVGQPTLLRRLMAMFYDVWLVAGCLLAGSGLVNLANVLLADKGTLVEGKLALNNDGQMVLFVVSISIFWGFFSYFWTRSGQTLSMQTWRLRIDNANCDEENQRISLAQATLRLCLATVSFSCFGLGYLWCLIDKDKQTLHDKLSKSRLVLLEKRQG